MRNEEVGPVAQIIHHTLARVPVHTQLIDDLVYAVSVKLNVRRN